MRILTFTSLFPNSMQPLRGVFVFQRVAHLARRVGNLIHVVAPVPYFPSWLPFERWQSAGRIPREEAVGSLPVNHPRYFLLPKVSMSLHGWLMYAGSVSLVRKLHRKMSFDCIDAHYVYPDGYAAVLLGRQLGIPVVVSARGTDISLFPTFHWIRPMIRWTLQHAAGVVGVCEALKDAMIELGAEESRARAIGNGIDLERFGPVNCGEARRRLGMPEEAEVIVSVGNLIPLKGFQFLIPAVAQIAPRHPSLRLYIIGEGESRAGLEALTREKGVAERVFFVGRKPNEELKFWYSAANVSCLASVREGWANVLLESLACGTPAVATRVWGTPEVISSPEKGVLVEPNSDSIAAGLEQALGRTWDRETLANSARQRTWDVVAEEVENFLASRVLAFHEQMARAGRA
jgi:teichuronic acid biosynthesis glycosyltransferase TuaC